MAIKIKSRDEFTDMEIALGRVRYEMEAAKKREIELKDFLKNSKDYAAGLENSLAKSMEPKFDPWSFFGGLISACLVAIFLFAFFCE